MADKSLTDKLCNASASGKLSEVLPLLENGVDVNGLNTYNRTALQVVMLGNTAVAEALLQKGANPNVRDPVCELTVIHDAARDGFADTVRVLIDHGADANLVDWKGNLPLHLAASKGHLEVVQLLIGRTADPRMTNNQGFTARALAQEWKDTAKYIDEYLRLEEEENEDEDLCFCFMALNMLVLFLFFFLFLKYFLKFPACYISELA
ncbi:cyclin-dependent kinase 4 inhibitor C isoform X2 [Toxotes jaculatrix]|uniref:cyclin-dependent kinase 4 inhibitor C isoform X2 n=1 Tax=Toxotes jaculatrix TaxID=941984 RepID=UPI001B3A9BF5|nr:cyclin-dependent kinase 4 inhibitor C isoform X2 [Toxotes jaculatrix]